MGLGVIEGHSFSSHLFLTSGDACASNMLQLLEPCEHVSTQAIQSASWACEPGVRNAKGFKLGSPRLLDVISPICVFQAEGGGGRSQRKGGRSWR